jgi:hypothetical protein
MKSIIAFLSGFGISFIGSIPLGYLNIVAYNIYTISGTLDLGYFLLGVITIECPVIYVIFKFARIIGSKPGLIKTLETASILFLIIITLATLFKKDNNNFTSYPYLLSNAYITGLLLNAVNFLQLPFWSGWGLYVMNNNIIDTGSKKISLFILGAGAGTITGMAIFVVLFSNLSTYFYEITNNIIAIVFLSLTLFQSFKYYKKYVIAK